MVGSGLACRSRAELEQVFLYSLRLYSEVRRPPPTALRKRPTSILQSTSEFEQKAIKASKYSIINLFRCLYNRAYLL